MFIILDCMKITGVVVVSVLHWLVLNVKHVLNILKQRVDIFFLLSIFIKCVRFIDLRDEHRKVNVRKQ